VHNDIDTPFPKPGTEPAYLDPMKALLKRHPKTTIIWAHVGLGRVVRPVKSQVGVVSDILDDPEMRHVYFDISWSETAKYLVATPETTAVTAEVMRKHSDRFLFGTDEVAPPDQKTYLRVFRQYEPLWNALDAQTRDMVCKGNYERIFDEARRSVRAWEKKHEK
jgi:predicted TIM-barrel fold metal-dependent hydrolase